MNGYQQVDEAPQGDLQILGVKMRPHPMDPALAGFAASARNARFTRRHPEPRLGLCITPWTNRVTATNAELTPFGRIFGDGEYKDANGIKWIIIAADGGVFKTRENNGSSAVALPPDVTVWRPVFFVSAAPNKLLLFRGRPRNIPVWNAETIYLTGQLVRNFSGDVYEQRDGTSEGVEPGVATGWEDYWRLTTEDDFRPLVLDDIDQGFRQIAQVDNDADVEDQNPDDGTEVIPSGTFGLAMQNRVFVPYDDDFVAASDYLNVTRYQPVLEAFRIRQGDGQSITALHEIPAQDAQSASSAAMLVAKEHSIAIVSNVRGDLSGMTRYGVTDEYGCISPRAVISAGKDVWFMAQRRGVSSLSQSEAGKFQAVDVPVSFDLEPLMARVNWRYAEKFHAAKVGNFSYWAVALDNAEVVKGEIIGQDVYGGGGTLSLTRMVVGRTYRWVKGNASSINFGAGAVTESGDYVCLSSTVTVTGSAGVAVTSELYPLFQGVCNAILVYDHLNQAWAGYDAGEMICPRALRAASVQGQARLLLIGEDGFISLYEELYRDQVYVYERQLRADVTVEAVTNLHEIDFIRVNGGTQVLSSSVLSGIDATHIGMVGGLSAVRSRLTTGYSGATWTAPNVNAASVTGKSGVVYTRFTPTNSVRPVITYDSRYLTVVPWGGVEFAEIDFNVRTRGYALRSALGRFRASCLALLLRTWNPRYTVLALPEGVNESVTICEDATRDRTRYRKPHTRARWLETNANDDHNTPFREDYSVEIGDENNRFDLGSGVDFSLHQESSEEYRPAAGARGAYVQFDLTSSQGRVEMLGIAIESRRMDKRKGVKV